VPEQRDGLLGVVGMKVDPARGLLWAASYASRSIEDYRSSRNGGGVYAFSLSDGSLRRRALFADGSHHLANDLAIAGDGTVYVSDSETGSLYRIPSDRDDLELVLPPDTFVYPNGLALAKDRRLYVADAIGIGIGIVDLSTRATKRMETAPRVAIGGIDGLLFDGDRLFAVQNGIGKPRLVAISVDGDRATALTVLENDETALELPTTSCLWQGALYTIANSQLGAFGPDGLRKGHTLADPRILRTPL
jgi:sugar lactone lactonase YvrE